VFTHPLLITLAVSSRHSHLGLRLTMDSGRSSQRSNGRPGIDDNIDISLAGDLVLTSLPKSANINQHTPFPTKAEHASHNTSTQPLFLPVSALMILSAGSHY
jgi:hypothetical protein